MTVDRAVRLMAGVMVLVSLALARWALADGVRRTESVAVRVHQLVPGDDVLSQDGSARARQGDAVKQLITVHP